MRITTALFVLLPGLLAAQIPYFGAIDQGPEWGTPWLVDVSVGADGNLSLLEKAMPDPELGGPFRLIVTGYSFQDGVLWRKLFTPSESWMNSTPMNIVRLSSGESLVFGLVPGGQLIDDYFLMRLGVDGSTIATTTFRLLDPVDEDFDQGGSTIHELADGSIVFSMALTFEPVFVHWSGGPAVDWARSFLPVMEDLKKCPAFDFAVLQDGGLLLTLKAYTTMFLVRLDADGDVVWSRNYLDFPAEQFNAVELANGDIAVCGHRALDPFLARLDAQGEMLWVTHLGAEHADYVLGGGLKRIHERSNGDLFVGSNNYIIGGPANSGFIRLNSAGEALSASSLQTVYDGGMGLVLQHSDQLILAGQATMTIDDEPHRVIPVARFDPMTSPYCLLDADVFTQETRSVSNITSEEHIVHEHSVSLSAVEWTVTDLIAPAFPTCAIHKDVLENPAPAALPIIPSIVERGGDIMIPVPLGAGPLTAEVLDMAGRVVMQLRPNGLDRIALTMDVDPGSYAVRMRDA